MSNDNELVARAIKGDEQAMALLYETYFDRIYRYAYLRLNNRTEAEDVAQDVFIRALAAIKKYEERDVPFTAWLFRIAHNQVIDHVRKEKREKRVSFDDCPNLQASEPPLDYLAEKNMEIEDITERIGKLSPAQREVISLRFGAEMPIAEVAAVLGKSQGTVKALQYNAVAALRKLISSGK